MIEIKIDLKPSPTPIIFQPVYNLIALLAILKWGTDKNRKASLLKIQLYLLALYDDSYFKMLIAVKNKERTKGLPFSMDNSLDKIIALAESNNYAKRIIVSGQIQIELTSTGNNLVEKFESKKIFTLELNKLKSIGNIPESKITLIGKDWSIK